MRDWCTILSWVPAVHPSTDEWENHLWVMLVHNWLISFSPVFTQYLAPSYNMFAYNLKFSPHSSSEAEARFGCFELNITMIMITYIQARNTLKLSRFTSFKCVDMLLRNIFQMSDPLVTRFCCFQAIRFKAWKWVRW